MSDIAKIEDAYLRGRNRFAKWKEEREKRFNQPLADSMTNALARVLVETVDQIPPVVQTELDGVGKYWDDRRSQCQYITSERRVGRRPEQ